MPTPNQSQLQGLIEGMTSVNADAQNAQPNNPNNGNPATVYNIPAMSNAAGNWWIPPSGSGVDMQAILSQLPQGGAGNSNINNILGNLTAPAAPNTGNPSGPSNPSNPVVPPNGPLPPGGTMPGPAGRPVRGTGGPPSVGDLSQPVHNQPWNLAANFNNAQPNTGQNVGRNAALPWAQTQWGATPLQGQAGGADLMNVLQGLGSTLSGELRQEFNSLLNDVTGRNGWQGLVGTFLDAFIPGASQLINQFFPRNDPTAPMDPEAMAQTNQQLATQLQGLINGIQQQGGANAQQRLEQLLSSGQLRMPAGWGDETMSQADWRNLQRQGGFNQFFSSAGNRTVNPITGMMSSDARGDFMNQLSAEALAMVNNLNRNRGDRRK